MSLYFYFLSTLPFLIYSPIALWFIFLYYVSGTYLLLLLFFIFLFIFLFLYNFNTFVYFPLCHLFPLLFISPPLILSYHHTSFRDMEYKLRPGMIMLTWTSMNIDAYKTHIHAGLRKLEELVVNINDIIESRIEKNLKMVRKIF